MIVSAKAPAGAVKAKYGMIEMLVADDGTLDVPAYVAKTLVGKAGFTTDANISASAVQMLGAGEIHEAQYILQAYGKPIIGRPDPELVIARDEALIAFTVANKTLEDALAADPVDDVAVTAARSAVETATANQDAADAALATAIAALPSAIFNSAKALIAVRGEPSASVE